MREAELDRFLACHPQLLWRGRGSASPAAGLSTGFAALDAALPGRGWPAGGVVEMIVPTWGVGELWLWLPAMRHQHARGRYVSWLAPPYLPYPPALSGAGLDLTLIHYIGTPLPDQDLFWAAEKLLACADSGLVLAWPRQLTALTLRRLQLAAQQNGGLLCLLRRPQQNWTTSAAALRIQLRPAPGGLVVQIHKARGSCHGAQVLVGEPWPLL